MLHSLWGYLSDKLGIPTSDLTRDNVSMELQSAGVSATVINDTIALIDECEFAKYASASGSDMDKYIAVVVMLLMLWKVKSERIIANNYGKI